jgi:hypothetical protein
VLHLPGDLSLAQPLQPKPSALFDARNTRAPSAQPVDFIAVLHFSLDRAQCLKKFHLLG